jgi:predicted DCC family thiol-disulfide oxidoreductase YuxK
LCDQIVQFILKHDKKEIFIFAPLQGKTAAEKLNQLPESYKTLDSLILIEDFNLPHEKISVLGQGAFRILWLLGGAWALIGWMCFLPPFLYNWGYRLVAKNRHRFFPQNICVIPDPSMKDRFLE